MSEDSEENWGSWTPHGHRGGRARKRRKRRMVDADAVLSEACLPPTPPEAAELDVVTAFLEESRWYSDQAERSAEVFSDSSVQQLAAILRRRVSRAHRWVARLQGRPCSPEVPELQEHAVEAGGPAEAAQGLDEAAAETEAAEGLDEATEAAETEAAEGLDEAAVDAEGLYVEAGLDEAADDAETRSPAHESVAAEPPSLMAARPKCRPAPPPPPPPIPTPPPPPLPPPPLPPPLPPPPPHWLPVPRMIEFAYRWHF